LLIEFHCAKFFGKLQFKGCTKADCESNYFAITITISCAEALIELVRAATEP